MRKEYNDRQYAILVNKGITKEEYDKKRESDKKRQLTESSTDKEIKNLTK